MDMATKASKPMRVMGTYLTNILRSASDPFEFAKNYLPDLTRERVEAILAERAWIQGDSYTRLEYVELDTCPECARSRGPNYRGKCEH